jgi:hypothetical protein
MSEPESTFVELGKRLTAESSLPENVAHIQARVATLKYVNDARVQREAAAELGREAIRLHGLALVPRDLQDRVREYVGTRLGPLEEVKPTATQDSAATQPQTHTSEKRSALSAYAAPVGVFLLVVLAALGRNGRIDQLTQFRPSASQPSRAKGSALPY